MQTAAPRTPRQPARLVAVATDSSDFKLRASATRTPFTTPRGPPTPPDSGTKRPTVSFNFPLDTATDDSKMSQESPIATHQSLDSVTTDASQTTRMPLSSPQPPPIDSRSYLVSLEHVWQPAFARVLNVVRTLVLFCHLDGQCVQAVRAEQRRAHSKRLHQRPPAQLP
jgi:hypothetical protein